MAIGRVTLAALFALSFIAVSCGDNDNDKGTPIPELTPASFTCTGPEGPPQACHEGNQCCGALCRSASAHCCQIPAGFPDAGQAFSCSKLQQCCGPGCVQIGSPCT